jgi:hypothetical protein
LKIDDPHIREWARLIVACLVLCAPSHNAVANNYTTSFPLMENPISENGNWINGMVVGLDWSNVASSYGMACGTQTGNGSGLGEYSDSTALLTGAWGSNQTVRATVKVVAVDSGSDEEIELRLRQSLSPHSCTGYEVTFSINPGLPYVQVVRWNGPLGNYTYVNENDYTDYAQNGDMVEATIVGSTISVYKNGKLLFTCADSTYSSGSPGMGFFLFGQGAASTYGFSYFSATDEIQMPIVPGITNGQFLLSFQTVAEKNYAIQQNTNLAMTNWQTLTNFTGNGLPYQFIMPASSAQPWLFFRVE